MTFTDIHIHALWGVDDGAKDEAQMLEILDAAYADGVRCICLTPHFHPGYWGDNFEKTQTAFDALQKIRPGRYPEMKLCLGNELRYSSGCISWLEEGRCRCLANTSYLLVDFYEKETAESIVHGLNRLLNAGYTPILAHAERYSKLPQSLLRECRSNGVLLQIDAQSLFGQFGLRAKWAAKALLRERMADFVASDAHNSGSRPPELSRAYGYIAKRYGEQYAGEICCENGLRLLQDHFKRKDV